MKEIQKHAFTNVVECPTCGAPLKVSNLTQWVVRECSEDAEHYSHETRRANNPMVITDGLTGEYVRDAAEAESFAALLADMTILAPSTIAPPTTTATITTSPPLSSEKAACEWEAWGIEFDPNGKVMRIPAGVPDTVIAQVCRE